LFAFVRTEPARLDLQSGLRKPDITQRTVTNGLGTLLDETDQRIVKACKEWPKIKNSPKSMATLYGYRQPIISNISRNLLALGLEKKPPPAKTLEEILSEDDEGEGDQTEAQ
jgi:hypothetical protein